MKPLEINRTPDRSPWVTAGGIALLLLLAWEFASRGSERVSFFLSRPSQVWDALVAMAISGTLLTDVGVTAGEALLGTGAGTVLGSAVGLALWLSKRATSVAAPFVVVAANFPIFALAPAAIVWLGIGIGMKVFLAAFATFFVSLNLAHQGAKLAQEQFGGVFDGFRASRWDTYRKIIVPGALDAVFNSMRVNVGLGILGAFIGEFIASEQGLGREIIRASGLYQIDRVFAASLCIIALAALFDRLAYGIQQEKLLLARAFGLPRRLRARTRELASRQANRS
jgi:NitT/TauT family transport system permease protein